MAKRSQQLKTNKQYKDAMRRLRGKVSFNYDLRKSLTPGQKSAISKAIKEIPNIPNTRFIKPPRKPGETGTKYARRLNNIKKSLGQENTPFNGIFIATKSNAHFSFKGDKVSIQLPDKEYTEQYIGINRVAFVNDSLRPAYLMGICQQANKAGYNKIALQFGYSRGLSEYDTDDNEFFAEQIEALINKYGDEKNALLKNEVINGFIFINRSEK